MPGRTRAVGALPQSVAGATGGARERSKLAAKAGTVEKGRTMRGSCLCGEVSYVVTGPLRQVVGCHCLQCRKTSGHHVAATQAAWSDVSLTRQGGLAWYGSSPGYRRGFCRICGSSLFWEELGSGAVSIMAGTLDGATGLVMDRHILVETKGDYYELPADAVVVAQAALRPG